MKRLLVILTCILVSNCFSQNGKEYVVSLTDDFTQKLVNRGITSFFTTTHYCSGTNQMFTIDGKMCSSRDSYFETYVLWNEEGKDFIKKIDNCGFHYSIELQDTDLSEFYAKEYPALMDDEVKPYRSTAYTGEPALRKQVQPCFREFTFSQNNNTRSKKFNLFAISNDSDGSNVNYPFNQTLKLVALNKKLEALLPSLSFKRQQ